MTLETKLINGLCVKTHRPAYPEEQDGGDIRLVRCSSCGETWEETA